MTPPQSNVEPGPDPEAAEYIRALTALVGDRDPLAVLSRLRETLEAAIAGVSEADLEKPESPGKWSMAQVIEHLADTELVYGYRLRMVLTGETPRFEDYDQERWVERFSGGRPLGESMRQIESLRGVNLRILDRLTDEDLGRVGVHSKRGVESVRQMLCLWAGHDLVHLRQIERIRRSLRGKER